LNLVSSYVCLKGGATILRRRIKSEKSAIVQLDNLIFSLLPRTTDIRIQKETFHVSYVCEKWFLTFREEHKFNVFGNKFRKTFTPEWDEVTE
jgi:hypothetical protein